MKRMNEMEEKGVKIRRRKGKRDGGRQEKE